VFRIATWNVNSLRVRLPQVLDWLAENPVDVIGLQETKLPDPDFPCEALEEAGYQALFAGQPTYNGVAILYRGSPFKLIATDLPKLDDTQRRVLCASRGNLCVLNLYVPNGAEVGSDKFAYKLDWLDKLRTYVEQLLREYKQLIVLGDFNIAPEDRDVHDPEEWRDKVLFSEPEKAAFRALLDLGLKDCYRLFDQPEADFSWWDYRAAGFRRNRGLRIDHILADARLAAKCTGCRIDKAPRRNERPSDHAPVIAEFTLK
jgi:exodeoxyribonuclease III